MNTLNITKEKVLEAASKCSTAKATLQALFPKAFEPEKPEPFKFADFDDGYTINHEMHNGPIAIGYGLVPHQIEGKCLIVGQYYRMETQEHKGQTILTFYKK